MIGSGGEVGDALEESRPALLAACPIRSPIQRSRRIRAVSGCAGRRIAEELNNWRFSIHRLGVRGCSGELGKSMGWAIWPPDRSTPRRFK